MRKALRTLMAHRQVMLRPLRPLKVHQPHPLASALLGIPVAPVDQGHRPVISLFSLLTFIFVLLKITSKIPLILVLMQSFLCVVSVN